jgi:Na+-transporting NADH:ubiquinone oxidoreductase subunit NqrB
MPLAHAHTRLDPRWYQIAALAGLLAYGLFGLDFEIDAGRVFLIVGSGLAAQWVCTRLSRLPRFDPKSALISALSLCLLLRTDEPLWVLFAVSVTIASKFLLRIDGKHVFNPTNLGLVVTLLLTDAAWVSPGQWGNAAFFGFLMACAGSLVVQRSSRSDVTLAFFVSYAGLLCARSLWLGEPLAIPVHRLQNGALLLFGFFMISDPRTTPDARAARIAFAFLVALGACFVQFGLFRTNSLLWSLAVLSPLVPLLNRLGPGSRFEWGRAGAPAPAMKGVFRVRNRAFPDRVRDAARMLARRRGAGVGILRLLRRQGRREAVQQGVTRRLGA